MSTPPQPIRQMSYNTRVDMDEPDIVVVPTEPVRDQRLKRVSFVLSIIISLLTLTILMVLSYHVYRYQNPANAHFSSVLHFLGLTSHHRNHTHNTTAAAPEAVTTVTQAPAVVTVNTTTTVVTPAAKPRDLPATEHIIPAPVAHSDSPAKHHPKDSQQPHHDRHKTHEQHNAHHRREHQKQPSAPPPFHQHPVGHFDENVGAEAFHHYIRTHNISFSHDAAYDATMLVFLENLYFMALHNWYLHYHSNVSYGVAPNAYSHLTPNQFAHFILMDNHTQHELVRMFDKLEPEQHEAAATTHQHETHTSLPSHLPAKKAKASSFKAPKAAKTPKAPKAPKAAKVPKAPKVPKAAKAPKAAKVPKQKLKKPKLPLGHHTEQAEREQVDSVDGSEGEAGGSEGQSLRRQTRCARFRGAE